MAKEKKEIEVVREKVEGAIGEVGKLAIKTDEDLSRAGTMLTNIKKLGKYIKQEKEKLTVPLNEALKNARIMFKPFEDDIEKAENQVSRAMSSYADKVEKERLAKEASIVTRVEKGQLKEETAVRKMDELGGEKKTIHNEGGSVTFTKTRKVRFGMVTVLDANVLVTLARNGYLIWDEVKARRDALAGTIIPGIEIYEETNTSTRV